MIILVNKSYIDATLKRSVIAGEVLTNVPDKRGQLLIEKGVGEELIKKTVKDSK